MSKCNIPDSPNSETFDAIPQRDLLRHIAGGALLLSSGTAAFLVGCGSGHSSHTSSQPDNSASGSIATESVIGVVNTAEIGGTGFTVQNAIRSSVRVDSTGGFVTSASSQGASLMVLADASGAVRALSLYIPTAVSAEKERRSSRSDVTAPIIFDAASTATALVFVTPGILAVDPAVAAVEIASIQKLPSFQPLRDFLATKLASSAITDPSIAGELETRKKAVVGVGYSANVIGNPTSPGYGFSGSRNGDGTITLRNQGFRYLSVIRRLLDADGKPLNGATPVQLDFGETPAGTPIDVMAGLESTELSSIFDGKAGTAYEYIDRLATQSVAGLAIVIYDIYGPGFATPPSADSGFYAGSGFRDAYTNSLICYVVCPLIEIVIGYGSSINTSEIVELIGATVSSDSSATQIAQSFVNPGPDTVLPSMLAWVKAACQVLNKAAPTLAEQLATKLSVPVAVVEVGFTLLGDVGLILSDANLTALDNIRLRIPEYTDVSVHL